MASIPGAILFLALALVRLDQKLGVLPLLLAAQSGLAAYHLVFRRKASYEAHPVQQGLAWLSALVPLVLELPVSPWWGLASAPGLLLNLWALHCLGSSFAIAPAERGLSFCGPYRRIRHPMYAGELAALLPAVLVNLSAWNLLVFGTFVLSIIWRIQREEGLLSGYELYAQFVPWKLIPEVW